MRLIKLTRGKFAKVDDEDFEMLSKYKWHYLATGCGYAKTSIYLGNYKAKEVLMHRMIMSTPKGMDTDHINQDGLDNRKVNLRICTTSENLTHRLGVKNRSLPKGVILKKDNWRVKKYQARIRVNNQEIHLGHYMTAEEASLAYDQAAMKYHGKFALTNREQTKLL